MFAKSDVVKEMIKVICPSIEEIGKLANNGEYKTAPVSTEIPSGEKTPIDILRILKNISGHCYILESVEKDATWGRYTFLGYDPKTSITCVNGNMKVDSLSFKTDDPGKYIRQILNEHKSPRMDYLPPFSGGFVGYFSYDYLKYSEPVLNLDAEDTEGFKDVDIMLFDKVIAFDNLDRKIVFIVNIDLSDADTNYNKAVLDLQQMVDLVDNGKPKKNEPGKMMTELKPLFDKERYCAMVETAKHHIREGDIFQMVLSNRLETEYEGSLLNTYCALRKLNPSPYMFYFSGSDMEVAGASPETLVKLKDGILHTFPLAGTRPRGKTEEEDKALEMDLLSDTKELAEHNMLVDLGRNDVGKISKFGTIKVEKYHSVERFSHVMHIGSTVCGEIRDGFDALDVLDAILPAGTLSGAPKIRACQLINDIEKNKRGIYGGAIGYIDFTGNLDTCIAIRIAYKKNGKVFIRTGAGIVADSVPEREYQECIDKAAAVVKALKISEGSE